ncbi:MAG: glycine--tRNA ligase subunit alpha, partial [Nitrospira sp. SB0678_bin_10]|nr:glycine--tRNA ligase subunit alpha [Nitrospira sp. SB0678_bin_10]
WSDDGSYGDLFHDSEVQFSHYHFEFADIAMIRTMFDACEAECRALLEKELVLPAYDYCMKSSHLFNVLDARGALSVAERTGYIGRVRGLARGCADAYVERRQRLGFPLLAGAGAEPAVSAKGRPNRPPS